MLQIRQDILTKMKNCPKKDLANYDSCGYLKFEAILWEKEKNQSMTIHFEFKNPFSYNVL